MASQPSLDRSTTGVWYGYCADALLFSASDVVLSNASWSTTTSLPWKKGAAGMAVARCA